VSLALVIARTFLQAYKTTVFERAGFLFLFGDSLFTLKNFQQSFAALVPTLPVRLIFTAIIFAILMFIFCWRLLNNAQRMTYILVFCVVAGLTLIGSMTALRYRDFFLTPYVIYILGGVSLGLLIQRYTRRYTGLIVLVGGLLFA